MFYFNSLNFMTMASVMCVNVKTGRRYKMMKNNLVMSDEPILKAILNDFAIQAPNPRENKTRSG